MKVSRKVGRRSHYSISRRRLRNKKSYKKNSYRKKYTQKGGSWGAKKGGARGRKYKRARTHKRGKRFHRGGVTEPITLSVKKNGKNFGFEFPEQPQTFNMTITISEDDNYANVKLERDDSSGIKFTIKALPNDFISFLQNLNNVTRTILMDKYNFQALQDDNGNGTYNFFTKDNIAKFKEIAEKIKKVKYDKDAELLRDELQKATEDKETTPNKAIADAEINLARARVNYLDAVINHNSDKDNAEYAKIVDETQKLLLEAENKLKNLQRFQARFFDNPF